MQVFSRHYYYYYYYYFVYQSSWTRSLLWFTTILPESIRLAVGALAPLLLRFGFCTNLVLVPGICCSPANERATTKQTNNGGEGGGGGGGIRISKAAPKQNSTRRCVR